MRFAVGYIGLLLALFGIGVARAQESLMPAVSSDASGLVLFVSAGLHDDAETLAVSDATKATIYEQKWVSGHPFVGAFTLKPGEYQIHIPGPIQSLRLAARPDAQVFLKIAPYRPGDGQQGIQVTSWFGKPTAEIENAFVALIEMGFEVSKATRLEPTSNDLYLGWGYNTERPYPSPFDPLPNEPKPPGK